MELGEFYWWTEHKCAMNAKAQEDRAVARLLRWLREREGEMAALLADLVAVPTENPPGRDYEEFSEVFEIRATKLGLRRERLTPSLKGSGRDALPPCLSVSHGG